MPRLPTAPAAAPTCPTWSAQSTSCLPSGGRTPLIPSFNDRWSLKRRNQMLQLAVNEFTWDHYQIDTVLWEHRQQPWADVAADYPAGLRPAPGYPAEPAPGTALPGLRHRPGRPGRGPGPPQRQRGLYLEDRRRPSLAGAGSPDHRCPGSYPPAPRPAPGDRPSRRPASAGSTSRSDLNQAKSS